MGSAQTPGSGSPAQDSAGLPTGAGAVGPPSGAGAAGVDPARGGIPIVEEMRDSKVPRWWPKAVIWLVAGALVGVALYKVYYLVDDVLLTLFISFFLALALEPVVNFFARRGWRRGLTTLLVFVVTLLGVAGFVVVASVFFIKQAQQLAQLLPQAVNDVVIWINDTFDQNIDPSQLQQEIANLLNQDILGNIASGALGIATSALGSIFTLFTVFLFTFFMVAEGPRFRRNVLSILKPETQQTVLYAWEVAIDRTGGYIISRGFLALLSTVVSFLFFVVIGLPSPLFLAIFVGVVSQFVPTIGTYIAGVLPSLVALFEGGWPLTVAVIVFIIVYQQIENYLFSPMITARTVEIHPAVAFGSVMFGAALLGGIGALIAIPAAATIQTLISQLVFRRRYDVIEGTLLEEPEVAIREAKKGVKGNPLRAARTAYQANEVRAKSDRLLALQMRRRTLQDEHRRATTEAAAMMAVNTHEAREAGSARMRDAQRVMEELHKVEEEIAQEAGQYSAAVDRFDAIGNDQD